MNSSLKFIIRQIRGATSINSEQRRVFGRKVIISSAKTVNLSKMALSVKASAKFIAKQATNVTIDDKGVEKLANEIFEQLKNGKISTKFSQYELHPTPDDPLALDWMFLLDLLNYSFWTPKESPKYTVNGQTGYFSLCAAVKRAIDRGIPIIEPKFYSQITMNQLKDIFKSDDGVTEMPLLDERLKHLNQAGQRLMDKYDGSFKHLFEKCEKSAKLLMNTVVEEFESFRDEAVYRGEKVAFYKRVQILVADIWTIHGGKIFDDIDEITMFADYRIPQVLVHFGSMKYSDDLMKLLKAGTMLQPGCEEESEIRGCSIEVVERVSSKVRDMIEQAKDSNLNKSMINAILIDYFLWNYRRQYADELEYIPFHQVRSIYY